MEFGGHVMIPSLVVANSIAIKNTTTLKIKRKNHDCLSRDSDICSLTRSAALALIRTWGLEGQ